METTSCQLPVKSDFPILQTTVGEHPLVYLDNAATTQKPQVVIDTYNHYYSTMNANVHRGVHHLSELATAAFEASREKVQKFINAKHSKECVFVKGTTEAINLVAYSFGEKYVQAGDEILISGMEHHSNIVPWQLLCERKGATLKVIPLQKNGELDLETIDDLLNEKTKLLSIVYASNSLGTVNPVKKLIDKAHAKDIPVLLDGAQATPHMLIDVQALDCDFYALSAHKMYGPMGIGLLYGKEKWLKDMPPFLSGGDMILQVSFEKSTFNELPYKFEAGTPPVAEAIAFGATIDYLNSLDSEAIAAHEKNLLDYAHHKLSDIPNLKFIGEAADKISVVSFVMTDIHPHDVGSITNQYGVAIRTGHHCTMPVMKYFDVPATCRASFGLYNTQEDVDQLYQSLIKVRELFKK